MTVHDDLDLAQRALQNLERAVRGLRLHFGESLDMRRVHDDVQRLGTSLAILRLQAPKPPAAPQPRLEVIPDGDYDRNLFTDAEDTEGLGAPDRRAP